jgi:hypothetical protein
MQRDPVRAAVQIATLIHLARDIGRCILPNRFRPVSLAKKICVEISKKEFCWRYCSSEKSLDKRKGEEARLLLFVLMNLQFGKERKSRF